MSFTEKHPNIADTITVCGAALMIAVLFGLPLFALVIACIDAAQRPAVIRQYQADTAAKRQACESKPGHVYVVWDSVCTTGERVK